MKITFPIINDFLEGCKRRNSLILRRCCYFIYIAFLLFTIVWCFHYYPIWCKVPTHYFEADLTTMGKISNYSFCELQINVDAGGDYLVKDGYDIGNKVSVNNDPLYKDSIEICKDFELFLDSLLSKNSNKRLQMKTWHKLDYKYNTTLFLNVGHKSGDEYGPIIEQQSITYTSEPQVEYTENGTKVKGISFLAYDKKELWGNMNICPKAMNIAPDFMSPWDITQANYFVKFHARNIKCRAVKFEFFGSTSFSEMNPKPDLITNSGIEFTNSTTIQEIMRHGLRFHAKFLEQEQKSAMRLFILTAILSLAISLFANIIHSFLFNKKNNG